MMRRDPVCEPQGSVGMSATARMLAVGLSRRGNRPRQADLDPADRVVNTPGRAGGRATDVVAVLSHQARRTTPSRRRPLRRCRSRPQRMESHANVTGCKRQYPLCTPADSGDGPGHDSRPAPRGFPRSRDALPSPVDAIRTGNRTDSGCSCRSSHARSAPPPCNLPGPVRPHRRCPRCWASSSLRCGSARRRFALLFSFSALLPMLCTRDYHAQIFLPDQPYGTAFGLITGSGIPRGEERTRDVAWEAVPEKHLLGRRRRRMPDTRRLDGDHEPAARSPPAALSRIPPATPDPGPRPPSSKDHPKDQPGGGPPRHPHRLDLTLPDPLAHVDVPLPRDVAEECAHRDRSTRHLQAPGRVPVARRSPVPYPGPRGRCFS